MVKVRLKTGRVGFGIEQRDGDVISLPADEARRMVDTRQAEYITTAVNEPPENRKLNRVARRN